MYPVLQFFDHASPLVGLLFAHVAIVGNVSDGVVELEILLNPFEKVDAVPGEASAVLILSRFNAARRFIHEGRLLMRVNRNC